LKSNKKKKRKKNQIIEDTACIEKEIAFHFIREVLGTKPTRKTKEVDCR